MQAGGARGTVVACGQGWVLPSFIPLHPTSRRPGKGAGKVDGRLVEEECSPNTNR